MVPNGHKVFAHTTERKPEQHNYITITSPLHHASRQYNYMYMYIINTLPSVLRSGEEA